MSESRRLDLERWTLFGKSRGQGDDHGEMELVGGLEVDAIRLVARDLRDVLIEDPQGVDLFPSSQFPVVVRTTPLVETPGPAAVVAMATVKGRHVHLERGREIRHMDGRSCRSREKHYFCHFLRSVKDCKDILGCCCCSVSCLQDLKSLDSKDQHFN